MKALIILSGGQDSTTCLALAIQHYGAHNVFAITFNYGQRHAVEVEAARKIAALALPKDHHEVVDIDDVLCGTSPLVNAAASVDQYKDVESLPGGLEKTFVPMRNTLFLTIAANRAVVLSMGDASVELVTGVSQEDYGGYPDCRLTFIHALEDAFNESLDHDSLPDIHFNTPLVNMTKRDTVVLSESIPGARELLAWSHTCYNGDIPPCGKCHACHLRAKGYKEAGVLDPLFERLADEIEDAPLR